MLQPGTTALVAFGAVGLAVWCRGLWLGAVPAGTDALRRRFLGGAAALVALSALLSPGKGTGVARFTDSLQLLVLGYFIIAPIAIALEHVQTLDGRATTARTVSLAWIVALLVPITAIVAVGLLLCNGVAPAVGWLMHVVTQAVLLLWFGFLWLLDWLGMVLYWLARPVPICLALGDAGGRPSTVGVTALAAVIRVQRSHHIPAFVPAMLLLLLAVLSVHFLARRSRNRPAEHVDEERSSLWSWQLLRDQFMTAWRALLRPLSRAGEGSIRRDGAMESDVHEGDGSARHGRHPRDLSPPPSLGGGERSCPASSDHAERVATRTAGGDTDGLCGR